VTLDGFVSHVLAGWLFGYTTLLSIINPFAGAFVFQGMTRWLTPQAQARLALAIARNSFIVLVVALFLGSRVLGFFGISLEALRIAGGLAVAVAGWRMMSEKPEETHQRRTGQATANALDTAPVEQMAFFPLTLPLTTGPGSIAASIALGAERQAMGLDDAVVAGTAAILIAASVAASIWVAYAYSAALARRLGPQGTLVATKLSAFLLLCIGAQIMLTGFTDALRPLFAPGGPVP